MKLSVLHSARARGGIRTVGVPHVGEELHRGRGEGVVFGELELGGEDAAFEGRAFGALDQGLPVQEIIFRDGAGGDAVRGVVREGAVLLEETAVGCALRHGRIAQEESESATSNKVSVLERCSRSMFRRRRCDGGVPESMG